MLRILFCLKYREGYWGAEGYTGSDLSSGLRNSVTFVVEMLNDLGFDAKLVQLADNNAIDKAIHDYQATHVVLEAFWVTPDKLDVLQALWPNVKWAVRNHSEMAFLSQEGIAMEWTYGYLRRGVEVMNNSPRAVDDMKTLARAFGIDNYQNLITYAPNYYPLPQSPVFHSHLRDDELKIGCFGAIRPLKNHLTQAIAAIKLAHYLGRPLEFHVNTSRVEGYGAPIVKNLRELFAHTPIATLVEHPWMPRTEDWDGEGVTHSCFLTVMKTMHFSLQCSFSETFNIVSSDAVLCGVPVITSAQVPWLSAQFHADPNDSDSIFMRMLTAEKQRHRVPNLWLRQQWNDLFDYTQRSQRNWAARYEDYGDVHALS